MGILRVAETPSDQLLYSSIIPITDNIEKFCNIIDKNIKLQVKLSRKRNWKKPRSKFKSGWSK